MAAELTLGAEDGSKLVLSLRLYGVRQFHADFCGRPTQVTGLEVEPLRERQIFV